MQPVGGFGADNLNKRCRLTCVLRFHSLDFFCRYFCNKWTRLDSAVFINISSLAERLADSLGTEHCWVRPGGVDISRYIQVLPEEHYPALRKIDCS